MLETESSGKNKFSSFDNKLDPRFLGLIGNSIGLISIKL